LQGMPEETCVVSPGELQPLLLSSRDTVVEAVEGSCTIAMEPECDTNSTKDQGRGDRDGGHGGPGHSQH